MFLGIHLQEIRVTFARISLISFAHLSHRYLALAITEFSVQSAHSAPNFVWFSHTYNEYKKHLVLRIAKSLTRQTDTYPANCDNDVLNFFLKKGFSFHPKPGDLCSRLRNGNSHSKSSGYPFCWSFPECFYFSISQYQSGVTLLSAPTRSANAIFPRRVYNSSV